MNFKFNDVPNDNTVIVDEVSITYWQNNDCTEEDNGGQLLTISTRDNGCDKFLWFKTEGWSIDSIDSLSEIFKDFKKRCEC